MDVPAGTFTMGSPEDEAGRDDDEGPQHRVTVSAFRMLRHEVMNAQYRRLVPDHQKEEPPDWPVTEVSWYDAAAFAAWLGARLPTEAEWEYAARGGTTGARYGEFDEVAWYDENNGAGPGPVMEKKANAWGLHDMLGNVWEWCADWYGEYAAPPQTDPTGPKGGAGRVLRGGSWSGPARVLRSADRSWDVPGLRVGYIGFRVVRPAPEP